MIRAIVFDCFGVLATEGWGPFRYTHFRDNPEAAKRASELMRSANSGRMEYSEFLAELGRMAGVPASQVERELHSNVADAELFEYMTTLKSQYKLGMLSNAAGDWTARIFAPEQLKLLDAIELSYESGYVKPEPEAYGLIARRLGAGAAECLMVDDQPRYCVAAEAAGMASLAYVDAARFKRELPEVLARVTGAAA